MVFRTPLYDWHRDAGARFIEFGGWEMPLQYSGIVEEHLAVRTTVGLFDVSHMGKLLLEGRGAHDFLNRLSANDVLSSPGRALYTHLLREDGAIVDDVIVTCLAPDRYLIVCNAGPRPAVVAWLEKRRPDRVTLDDRTTDYLCLALQGPRAPAVLQRFTSADLSALRPFAAAILDFRPPAEGGPTPTAIPPEIEGWGGVAEKGPSIEPPAHGRDDSVSSGNLAFLATRTGYTGEAGFEMFPPAGWGRWVWESLLAEGADLGIRPVGLGARDTLRLEKGYLLSGQDFDGRQTPLESASGWLVKWDHDFIGKEALEAQCLRGDYPRLVGVRMDDKGIPRHGCRVLAGGSEVGTVTSGTMSPSLRVGITLARVHADHAATGTILDVEIRGIPHPAKVAKLPFL